jgi:hypothetical protein
MSRGVRLPQTGWTGIALRGGGGVLIVRQVRERSRLLRRGLGRLGAMPLDLVMGMGIKWQNRFGQQAIVLLLC